MNNDNYEKVIISGLRCLKGFNIPLQDKECFGIKVGERITKIGQNSSSSSYEANFTPYVTYSGQIDIQGEIFATFRTPENGVTGFNKENPPQPVYIVFTISEEQSLLYRVSDKQLVTYPIYPIFLTEKGELRIYNKLFSPQGDLKHKKMIEKLIKKAQNNT